MLLSPKKTMLWVLIRIPSSTHKVWLHEELKKNIFHLSFNYHQLYNINHHIDPQLHSSPSSTIPLPQNGTFAENIERFEDNSGNILHSSPFLLYFSLDLNNSHTGLR